MVEKHYCDVCGEETNLKNNLNHSTNLSDSVSSSYDICINCLKSKSIAEILLKIGKQGGILRFDMPSKFMELWKANVES